MTAVAAVRTSDRTLFPRYLKAEIATIVRRPGIRAAVVVWLLQILLFAYVVQYIVYRSMGSQMSAEQADGMLRSMSLDLVGPYVAGSVPGYGIPVFVILGALAAAADHRWGTMSTIVARCPRRAHLILARFVAVAIVCLVTAVLTVVLGVGAALVIGATSGQPTGTIDGGSLLASAGATWLMAFAYASFGMTLGFVLRNAMTASAVGVAWLVAVEMLAVGALAGALPVFDAIRRVLLSPNVGAVTAALDPDGALAGSGLLGVSAVNTGLVAVLVIAVWIALGLVVSVRAFTTRDLTD